MTAAVRPGNGAGVRLRRASWGSQDTPASQGHLPPGPAEQAVVGGEGGSLPPRGPWDKPLAAAFPLSQAQRCRQNIQKMKGRIHLAARTEGSCGAARTEREDRWVVLNAADVRDQARGGATSQLPEQPQQTSAVGGRKRTPVHCCWGCKSTQPLWKHRGDASED